MGAEFQNDQGLLDAALEIAAQRANTLRQLRDALERNDNALALSIARKVCGLNDKTMLRAVAGQHRRAGDGR